jgi:hypothetical protein
MVGYSAADVSSLGRLLGHFDLSVIRTVRGDSWVAVCACGYRSVKRRTHALATSAAVHHLETAVRTAILQAPGHDIRSLLRVQEALVNAAVTA